MMDDYENIWTRLKVLVDGLLTLNITAYDNASDRLGAHYLYGKVEAYQRIYDLMCELDGDSCE